MSTQTFTMYLYMEYGYTSDYSRKEWAPDFWSVKVPDTATSVFVGEREIQIDVPDDFDPTARVVAALEAEKQEALEKYQCEVARINKQLSEYLAIENVVEVEA